MFEISIVKKINNCVGLSSMIMEEVDDALQRKCLLVKRKSTHAALDSVHINFWRIFMDRMWLDYIMSEEWLLMWLSDLLVFHLLDGLFSQNKDAFLLEEVSRILQWDLIYLVYTTDDDHLLSRLTTIWEDKGSEAFAILNNLLTDHIMRDWVAPADPVVYKQAEHKFNQGMYSQMSHDDIEEIQFLYHDYFHLQFDKIQQVEKEWLCESAFKEDLLTCISLMRTTKTNSLLLEAVLSWMIQNKLIYLVVDSSSGPQVTLCASENLHQNLWDCSLVLNVSEVFYSILQLNDGVKKYIQSVISNYITDKDITIDVILEDLRKSLYKVNPDNIEMWMTVKKKGLDSYSDVQNSLPYRTIWHDQHQWSKKNVVARTKREWKINK